MKRIILVVLLCIALCCSCKSQSYNTFTYIGDVNFPVGFTANDRCSGLFYQDNEPYYYFGELTSRKIIKIFDKNAKLVKEISLKNLNLPNTSHRMCMPSMDSIVMLFGHPLIEILVADSNGKTIFEKWFPPFIRTDTVDYALNAPRFYKPILYNNKIYLKNDAFKQLSDEMTTEKYVAFRKYAIKEPLICKIELDDPNKKPIYFGNDFSKKIFNNDSIERFTSYATFKIENNYLFDLIEGYGKILVIDLKTDSIFKILNIHHKNKPIGIEQRIFKDYQTYSKDEEEALKNWFINNVIWDKYRKVYYMFLLKNIGITSKQTCFIQIYDQNLNFQKEIKFNGKGTHLYFDNVLITDKGLMIQDDSPNNNKNIVYKLYNVNL